MVIVQCLVYACLSVLRFIFLPFCLSICLCRLCLIFACVSVGFFRLCLSAWLSAYPSLCLSVGLPLSLYRYVLCILVVFALYVSVPASLPPCPSVCVTATTTITTTATTTANTATSTTITRNPTATPTATATTTTIFRLRHLVILWFIWS